MRILASDVIYYFKDNQELLSRLVDNLMLDELLCGECDSRDFFMQSLHDAINDVLKEYHEKRLAELNGGE